MEKVALSVIARFCAIISRVSPSPLSDVLPEEEESKESAVSSTKKPEVCSRSSWRTLFEMPSLTPNMPRERQLHLLMLSML